MIYISTSNAFDGSGHGEGVGSRRSELFFASVKTLSSTMATPRLHRRTHAEDEDASVLKLGPGAFPVIAALCLVLV